MKKTNLNIQPKANSQDLLTQSLADELLVYNLQTNKAICLNPTAAFIWGNCNGENSLSDLRNSFNHHFSAKIESDFILLTLEKLEQSALIEPIGTYFENNISRRKALLHYALPIAMIPVVSTIIAPLSVHAASNCDPGITPCNDYTDCDTGFICGVDNCCTIDGEGGG